MRIAETYNIATTLPYAGCGCGSRDGCHLHLFTVPGRHIYCPNALQHVAATPRITALIHRARRAGMPLDAYPPPALAPCRHLPARTRYARPHYIACLFAFCIDNAKHCLRFTAARLAYYDTGCRLPYGWFTLNAPYPTYFAAQATPFALMRDGVAALLRGYCLPATPNSACVPFFDARRDFVYRHYSRVLLPAPHTVLPRLPYATSHLRRTVGCVGGFVLRRTTRFFFTVRATGSYSSLLPATRNALCSDMPPPAVTPRAPSSFSRRIATNAPPATCAARARIRAISTPPGSCRSDA